VLVSGIGRLKSLSAERAIFVFPFHRFTAAGAAADGTIPNRGPCLAGFGGNSATTPALQKRSPLFDAKDRQEKDREIVIDLLEMRLVKAAGRAHPGLLVEGFCFGLYSGDKKKHGFIAHLVRYFICETVENQYSSYS